MNYKEKILDIRAHPEQHQHADLNELTQCCLINGALDLAVMEAHEGLQGRNGGKGCDVRSGPCACGAWH